MKLLRRRSALSCCHTPNYDEKDPNSAAQTQQRMMGAGGGGVPFLHQDVMPRILCGGGGVCVGVCGCVGVFRSQIVNKAF